MSILVTGGAGYIGSHTCLELLSAGYDIVVVDNLVNSSLEAIRRMKALTGQEFPFYHTDLLDRQGMETIFEQNQIDAVIHLAGLKSVGESVKQPLSYYHTNMTGTLVLLQLMQEHRVKRIVFSSSATVYGTTESVPIAEDAPLGATNAYGRTKLMIEEMMTDLHASDTEWSIALLRYFNPVGAHSSGYLGEDPNGKPNNLMPFITQVAVGRLKELQIYGNDYATPDGTGVRDYIHVVDLARGHLNALEKVMAGSGIEAYNLGTGRGYSVKEIITAFEKVTGISIPHTFTNRRTGDIGICYSDPSKAERELGWVAQKGIEDMCQDAWRWQASNPYGYQKDVYQYQV
ncbi:UDP-glucose 4-epimerase [Paenibacillus marchantiophytorum]|uniref:UDP-glucose 4-epimerase n=1 Tax=Paenibacillus marchantiophytorum TaxID=1619310 RepID=A0ABQ2BRU3_9BACL|nr:UDP-glucose 4-epimerase GalE [Paenibacillus marchantiophytorum]GGI46060.1 UDP-glucose 4-epimerase [Paenibacillus marchantiophytorum]